VYGPHREPHPTSDIINITIRRYGHRMQIKKDLTSVFLAYENSKNGEQIRTFSCRCQTQIGSITKVLYWEIVKRLHWGCANVGLLCFVRNTLVPLVVQEMFSEFTFLCRMLATEKF
jgi:hypothetical protein